MVKQAVIHNAISYAYNYIEWTIKYHYQIHYSSNINLTKYENSSGGTYWGNQIKGTKQILLSFFNYCCTNHFQQNLIVVEVSQNHLQLATRQPDLWSHNISYKSNMISLCQPLLHYTTNTIELATKSENIRL